jgi:hypothetical protein
MPKEESRHGIPKRRSVGAGSGNCSSIRTARRHVEAWFAKHFHGLGSMLDERLYNHVHAAKEDLKAELRTL